MNRIIMTALLAMVCFFASGKKVVKSQWPDGSTISEWFTDTVKTDVMTLGKQYVITKYGVKNDPSILQTQQIQAGAQEIGLTLAPSFNVSSTHSGQS